MALHLQQTEEKNEVRGLQIPMQGFNMILPDSIVIQVLAAKDYADVNEGPGWMMGMVEWQKRLIPVVSFESAAGRPFKKPKDILLLVIKSLKDYEEIPFYAIFLSGIPHPVRFNEENLSAVENASIGTPLIHTEVLVYGEQSSIPNLDVMEEMIHSQQELIENLVEHYSDE